MVYSPRIMQVCLASLSPHPWHFSYPFLATRRSPASDDFWFREGSHVSDCPLPSHVPPPSFCFFSRSLLSSGADVIEAEILARTGGR